MKIRALLLLACLLFGAAEYGQADGTRSPFLDNGSDLTLPALDAKKPDGDFPLHVAPADLLLDHPPVASQFPGAQVPTQPLTPANTANLIRGPPSPRSLIHC